MYNPQQTIELFHLQFLKQLEKVLDKNLYCLKGGCNLRFFYQSIRYSEDIDFDIQKIAKETLQKKISKILLSIPFQNILKSSDIERVSFSEPKQTETTLRWKISLEHSKLSLTIPTKIEFSRRTMEKDRTLELVHQEVTDTYKLFPILSPHYGIHAALSQKIKALAHRTETQARDVFDLKLLLNQKDIIIKKLDVTKNELAQSTENALSLNYETFHSQVVAFLLPEHQEIYKKKTAWERLQKEVIEKLDELKL